MTLKLRCHENTVIIPVKVVPGSSRSRVAGIYDSALKINLAAPPEKGKANKQLLRLLAQILHCSPADLAVTAGLTNPHKEITVTGLSLEHCLHALDPYLKPA